MSNRFQFETCLENQYSPKGTIANSISVIGGEQKGSINVMEGDAGQEAEGAA